MAKPLVDMHVMYTDKLAVNILGSHKHEMRQANLDIENNNNNNK